jgi:hypothetical protein
MRPRAPALLPAVVNLDLDGHPIFGIDRSGDMTLAGGVFDEIDASGPSSIFLPPATSSSAQLVDIVAAAARKLGLDLLGVGLAVRPGIESMDHQRFVLLSGCPIAQDRLRQSGQAQKDRCQSTTRISLSWQTSHRFYEERARCSRLRDYRG